MGGGDGGGGGGGGGDGVEHRGRGGSTPEWCCERLDSCRVDGRGVEDVTVSRVDVSKQPCEWQRGCRDGVQR